MTLEEMKQIKEERGYSFDVLSAYSGVPRATLVRIFDGTSKQPRKATLDAIERVLGGDEAQYPGKKYHFGLSSDFPEYNVLFRPDYSDLFWVAERRANPDKDPSISAVEFLNTHTDKRTELIEGEVVVMEDPLFIHSEIAQHVFLEFHSYIKSHQKKCRPVVSGTNVILGRRRNRDSVLCPDFFVIRDEKRIIKKGVNGAPDFVLEVTSPSNSKRDFGIKSVLYMDAGVREYWIISPQKRILVRYLQENEGIPEVYPLTGKLGVHIYDNELELDLSEINALIDEDAKRDEDM